ncbi:hypothetical protein BSU04_25315 [Caballeronia sordidicola]|uniref:Uncharacterized protein n=1 Tax=Caballeronia sordidicola TaxID=196367 RepID=A0A226WX14_CABSO|nr:hypothetical protein BSU04_25315 [Caballeronia sordidicola]
MAHSAWCRPGDSVRQRHSLPYPLAVLQSRTVPGSVAPRVCQSRRGNKNGLCQKF